MALALAWALASAFTAVASHQGETAEGLPLDRPLEHPVRVRKDKSSDATDGADLEPRPEPRLPVVVQHHGFVHGWLPPTLPVATTGCAPCAVRRASIQGPTQARACVRACVRA